MCGYYIIDNMNKVVSNNSKKTA